MTKRSNNAPHSKLLKSVQLIIVVFKIDVLLTILLVVVGRLDVVAVAVNVIVEVDTGVLRLLGVLGAWGVLRTLGVLGGLDVL